MERDRRRIGMITKRNLLESDAHDSGPKGTKLGPNSDQQMADFNRTCTISAESGPRPTVLWSTYRAQRTLGQTRPKLGRPRDPSSGPNPTQSGWSIGGKLTSGREVGANPTLLCPRDGATLSFRCPGFAPMFAETGRTLVDIGPNMEDSGADLGPGSNRTLSNIGRTRAKR